MDDTAAPAIDDAEGATDTAGAPAPRSSASVPLKVTEAALEQVLSILSAEDNPELLALRIEVTGTRGPEYTYDLAFEERTEAADDDLIYDQGDLTVMVPRESVDSLWGATLDLPSTAGQGGLVIRNPNRPDPLAGFEVDLQGTVTERVQQLLEQSINPSLASHGGYAELVEVVDESKAVITMGGGCQGCAVSAVTLREGIQKAILEYIPEITEVIDSTDHDAGENPFYAQA